jgi:hypothetical protein
MVGKKDCLINIEHAHWERLKTYWSKPKTKRKEEQMTIMRSKVLIWAMWGNWAKPRRGKTIIC